MNHDPTFHEPQELSPYAEPVMAKATAAPRRSAASSTRTATKATARKTAAKAAKSTTRATSKATPKAAPKTTKSAGEAEMDARLVEKLMIAIRERINSGEVPVGSWLRQERLAQELGVSRMPIREALRQLQTLGIVEIIANRGARVRLPSARDVIEVYELRAVLEAHAGAGAAKLITTEQLDRLQHAIEMFRQIIEDLESDDPDASATARIRWYEANKLFHSTIVEASGNLTLSDVLDSLRHKIPSTLTWVGLGTDDVRRLKRNLADHEQILDAIAGGDAERTRRLFAAYNKNASELLVRALDNLLSGRASPVEL